MIDLILPGNRSNRRSHILWFLFADLEGFTGIGHSIEDCLYQARWGMEEHIGLLKEQSLPVPQENPDPKIIIQNQESLARAS